MSEHTLTISVVTYNSETHIGGLLDSLIQNIKDITYHIYVIDNSSSDKTVSIVIEKDYPSVTLFQSKNNKGFGSGHNLILEHINSKYHACVNPDIIVNNDVMSELVKYMDNHEDIGIITPKILNSDGSPQVLPKKEPKLLHLISRRVNLRFLRKYRNEYEMIDKNQEQKFDIEFCSGCFMFMRTSLFKKLGGFDERYFMYFEDADLTRRIRQEARAEYNPDFKVYHLWERAGNKKVKYFLIQIKSMIKYMIKWRKPIMKKEKLLQ